KGLLLVVPGGAFGMVDRAVMVGVDLVEALAEPAVAVGFGKSGEPIVIRLGLFNPRPLPGLQFDGGQLCGQLRLPALDKVQPPLAVLLEGNRLIGSGRRSRGRGLVRGSGLRGLANSR